MLHMCMLLGIRVIIFFLIWNEYECCKKFALLMQLIFVWYSQSSPQSSLPWRNHRVCCTRPFLSKKMCRPCPLLCSPEERTALTCRRLHVSVNQWRAISFFSTRYDIDTILGFFSRYDTIRYEGFKKDLLFKEFSANFRQIFRIFGKFSEFLANFWNFRRCCCWGLWFMGFRNFRGIFWIYGKKRQKKSLVLRISRYLILEVRYDILFDILKVSIYRHSIISRYD